MSLDSTQKASFLPLAEEQAVHGRSELLFRCFVIRMKVLLQLAL